MLKKIIEFEKRCDFPWLSNWKPMENFTFYKTYGKGKYGLKIKSCKIVNMLSEII